LLATPVRMPDLRTVCEIVLHLPVNHGDKVRGLTKCAAPTLRPWYCRNCRRRRKSLGTQFTQTHLFTSLSIRSLAGRMRNILPGLWH
jgi:hypothetical protein